MTKTTPAQKRATGKYRSKTIKKEITINPETNPKLAQWISDEQYKHQYGKSFNQFTTDLIMQHLGDQTDDTK
nr:hypothetical protein [uncultured Psychrobacter sp.]